MGHIFALREHMRELQVPHLSAILAGSSEWSLAKHCRSMVATGSSASLTLGHSPQLASFSSSMATKDPLKHSKSSDALLEGPYYGTTSKCSASMGKNHKEVDESDKYMFPFRKNASEDSVVVVGLSRDEHHPRTVGRSVRGDSGVHEGQGSARADRRHRAKGHHDDLGRSGVRRHLGLCDRVDPEDSIKDMVIENDFYRYVLFKRHYEKYISLSKKYEEAKNMVYYLEEKYHEVKAELDDMREIRRDLEHRLEHTELELHDKEEELFLQLEKVVRLEEECEKLRREAAATEATRRKLEVARWDVVRQMAVVAAERESLEKENELLRGNLSDERKELGNYLIGLDQQRNTFSRKVVGLEKKVTELQFAARQTASLNSHLKKGMKHLASCKKRKCSVCHYTRSIFGEYDEGNRNKLFSCIQSPLQEVRNWIVRPISHSESSCSDERVGKGGCSEESVTSEEEGAVTPSGDASSPFSITPSASIGCLLHSTTVDASSPSPRALEPAHLLSSLPLTYCSCQRHCKDDSARDSPHHCCPLHPEHSPTIDISYIDDSCPSVEGILPCLEDGKDGMKASESKSNGSPCHANGNLSGCDTNNGASYAVPTPCVAITNGAGGRRGSTGDGQHQLPSHSIVPPSAKGSSSGVAISFSCASPQMCSPCLPLMDNSQASMSPSESEPPRPSTKSSGVLSSDSGFSSELCEASYCSRGVTACRRLNDGRKSDDSKVESGAKEPTEVGCASAGGFNRSKWTMSFRKLIHKVSKK